MDDLILHLDTCQLNRNSIFCNNFLAILANLLRLSFLLFSYHTFTGNGSAVNNLSLITYSVYLSYAYWFNSYSK